MIEALQLTADDRFVLDNMGWHALTTVHAPLSVGAGPARRYESDVSVFAALEHDSPAAWDALGHVVDESETVVITRADPVQPGDGWIWLGGGFGNQMVLPDVDGLRAFGGSDGVDVVRLSHDDVDRMLTLVEIAQPGPFRPRTIELGHYYGVFDDTGELVAMAGERFQTPRFAELSAVCTHPRARGRGLAARLTSHVASGIAARGQIPVLHVAHGNDDAQRVYDRLGFVVRRVASFAAVQRRAPTA